MLIKGGATSVTIEIAIQSSISAVGGGLSGLTSSSSGLKIYYSRPGSASVQITLQTQTVTGAWTSSGGNYGFVEIDNANMIGVYRLDLPNAMIASGVPHVVLYAFGAANMVPAVYSIDLVAFDPQDAVHLGLSSLPNTAVTTNASLLTSGSSTDQLSVSGGRAKGDVSYWNGTVVSSPATAGIPDTNVKNYNNQAAATDSNNLPKVDTEDWKGNAVLTAVTNGVPLVDWLPSGGRQNTAAAGASGSITLDASASATNNFYKYMIVYLLGGTGAGQARIITGYTGSTQVATISPNWTTNPDSSSKFVIYPLALADLETIVASAVSTSSAQLGVNVVNIAGQAAVLDGNNLLEVDVQDWHGGATPAPNVTGEPLVDENHWRGTQPNVLQSGRVDAYVGAQGLANLTANVQQWSGQNVATPLTNGVPVVDWIPTGTRQNTAQAGAAGTITLDASASATDNFYKYMVVYLLSGSGAGQARLITGYTGSTKVATVAPNWTTNPSSSSVFVVYPFGIADLETILASTVATSSAQIGVNVVNWSGGAVPSPNVTGVPKVDTVDWLGTAPNSLQSGRVDSYLGAAASGVLGIRVKKNTAFSNFPIMMVSTSDHITGKTSATVAVQIQKDNGTFATATNSPATEVANGLYIINFTSSELNGDVITIFATASGADNRMLSLTTQTA